MLPTSFHLQRLLLWALYPLMFFAAWAYFARSAGGLDLPGNRSGTDRMSMLPGLDFLCHCKCNQLWIGWLFQIRIGALMPSKGMPQRHVPVPNITSFLHEHMCLQSSRCALLSQGAYYLAMGPPPAGESADTVEDENVEIRNPPQLTEELIGPDFMSERLEGVTRMILNVYYEWCSCVYVLPSSCTNIFLFAIRSVPFVEAGCIYLAIGPPLERWGCWYSCWWWECGDWEPTI